MRIISADNFNLLIEQAHIKRKLRSELRFVTSTDHIKDKDWQDLEFVCVSDRTGNKGVFIIELHDELYITPYELRSGLTNSQTGRSQALICDFCRTWQAGSNAGTITFTIPGVSLHTMTFLCCADLACSKHVRTKTKASILSRAQLREDLTDERRVERLRGNLEKLIKTLGLQPMNIKSPNYV